MDNIVEVKHPNKLTPKDLGRKFNMVVTYEGVPYGYTSATLLGFETKLDESSGDVVYYLQITSNMKILAYLHTHIEFLI